MIKLNSLITELIGLHVGDGTLYRTGWGLVWELRGGLDEKDYYNGHLTSLLNSIFSLDLKPKFRSGGKNGCYGFQTSKKEVTEFFLYHGFKPGSKVRTVRIPDYIKGSDESLQRAFVRGLFDTDGCLLFDRINNDCLHRYPKIEFSSASVGLRDDLLDLLRILGFRAYIWSSRADFRLCLAGEANLLKFMREVAPKNKKHLKKYLSWKRDGFYIPNAGVA